MLLLAKEQVVVLLHQWPNTLYCILFLKTWKGNGGSGDVFYSSLSLVTWFDFQIINKLNLLKWMMNESLKMSCVEGL